MTHDVTIVPANEASWGDLQAVFGTRGYTSTCQCQRFKADQFGNRPMDPEERAWLLRVQSAADHPESDVTSGLVAYLDGEPVGWCAVEPRTAYQRLPVRRVALKERGEDPADKSVWALTCFATRAGYRGRGFTYPLARAAVEFARARGARAIEGYPMTPEPGQDITWGETHVGTRSVFAAAGFEEVAHPTLRRLVMRIDFSGAAS
jgi:GNAT superfamily N-acetyltransferase